MTFYFVMIKGVLVCDVVIVARLGKVKELNFCPSRARDELVVGSIGLEPRELGLDISQFSLKNFNMSILSGNMDNQE